MKVRLKREIVTMGQPDIRPSEQAGEYVEAADWNKLISEPDVLVVDTRNSYETAIGQFRGATDPQTTTFREFPAWAKAPPKRRNKTARAKSPCIVPAASDARNQPR